MGKRILLCMITSGKEHVPLLGSWEGGQVESCISKDFIAMFIMPVQILFNTMPWCLCFHFTWMFAEDYSTHQEARYKGL